MVDKDQFKIIGHGTACKAGFPVDHESMTIGKVLTLQDENGESRFIRITEVLEDGIAFDLLSVFS